MEAYGFADWDGNDRHFMGWAGTGVHFDPIIASNAAHWLQRANAGRSATGRGARRAEPWFLTVALVNPHDVMWFPVDQPGYEERHPDDVAAIRRVLESAAWKDDDPLPDLSPSPTTRSSTELPANFDDDLHTKPEAHRQWRWDQQHGLWGYIDPGRHQGVAPPPRLLRRAPPAGRPQPRHGARRPRGLRCVGRHRGHLHLRPRRHVRVARTAVQGPVRLRRDHAGAAVREGARA